MKAPPCAPRSATEGAHWPKEADVKVIQYIWEFYDNVWCRAARGNLGKFTIVAFVTVSILDGLAHILLAATQ